MNAILRTVRRFVGWLFGAPFVALPREFGNEVPAELRVFESETEEARRETREQPAPERIPAGERTKPVRQEVSENERSYQMDQTGYDRARKSS